MWKFIKMLIAGIAVSFYFFPFEFTFLPGINTKMAMAAVGLILFVLDYVRKYNGRAVMNKEFLSIFSLAIIFSLLVLCSVILNNSSDYSYATYFVSMSVWVAGAYFVIKVIKLIHKEISVRLLCNYLIAVCVGQCIIALCIDNIPEFKDWINRYILGFDFVDLDKLNRLHRLYGIGAALDVAGTRFAAVLIMIAFLTKTYETDLSFSHMFIYMCSFVFIAIVGNMLARTTVLGVVIALLYWIIPNGRSQKGTRALLYIFLTICVTLPYIVHLYNTNESFYNDIRFAFEGFFSLAEKGKWEVGSNDILVSMIVFPDEIKTWIIGDGYFVNPGSIDAYYVGEQYMGYYKGTDIGYLRFIFYCGLIGLTAFILFFFKVAKFCANRLNQYALLFYILLFLNLVIWFKVSTDIFVVFALFLVLGIEDDLRSKQTVQDL